MDLQGAVAIVTGGSGGLGRTICAALAAAGADVAVIYSSRESEAALVVREVEVLGRRAKALRCDVTDPTSIAAMVGQVVTAFGRVDILVNDAGYNVTVPYPDLDGLTLDVWSKIMNVNLTGPMLCIKAVAGAMKTNGHGRIVNIASVAGLAPTGSSIAYAVSKAGVVHLTRCMAVALAPEVLVNCVAPGLLDGTAMTARLAPEQIERALKASVLGRAADKADVAAQVVAMCRTDTMTGQTVVVDAGRFFH